ncbi:hypothetical protein P7K49_012829, partial [Saguinus oedipus]
RVKSGFVGYRRVKPLQQGLAQGAVSELHVLTGGFLHISTLQQHPALQSLLQSKPRDPELAPEEQGCQDLLEP